MRTTALLAALALAACGTSQPASTPPDLAAPPEIDSGNVPPLDAGGCRPPGDAGAEPPFSADYAPKSSGSVIQDKAFYLLTLLSADRDLLAGFAADPAVSAISRDRDLRARTAAIDCGADGACYAAALKWTPAEIAAAGTAVVEQLRASSRLAPLATDHLRPSGRFNLHWTEADAALAAAAWTDTMTALDDAWDGYAASLDGASLRSLVQGVVAAHADPMPLYQPLLEVVLAAMAAQGRDEAARYEPLATGENAAALARVPTIDWAKYPYSIILVPGQGPTTPDVVLDPQGRVRCDLAALRYQAGLAPLIVTSGGHVHPDRTRYCEAIEMKKYLVTMKGIPESAILVDPHARHTTTNLRDVERLIYRYRIPADRPVLVTSDQTQSAYIALPALGFDDRCAAELFYWPWRIKQRLTPNDTCLLPSTMSLYVSGLDALDP